jgi:hypothetical protein
MPLQPASTGKQLTKHHKTKGCYSCQSKPARSGVRVLPRGRARRNSGVRIWCNTCKKWKPLRQREC